MKYDEKNKIIEIGEKDQKKHQYNIYLYKRLAQEAIANNDLKNYTKFLYFYGIYCSMNKDYTVGLDALKHVCEYSRYLYGEINDLETSALKAIFYYKKKELCMNY